MSVGTEDNATSTGSLSMPAEPDTTAQSITEAILKDIATEPIKKKPGRPKKAPEPVAEDDDDSAPPAHLKPIGDEEPEAEPEHTDVTDDVEEESAEPDTKSRLQSLATDYGVDPSFFDGCESEEEAQRLFHKLGGFFYNAGQLSNTPPEPEPPQRQPAKPAAKAVQKKDDDVDDDLDLSDLDDDEPLKKQFSKLQTALKNRDKRLAVLEEELNRNREAEFTRVQQQMAREFANEFSRVAPDLFGEPGKQDERQYARMQRAFEVADTFIRGGAASNRQLPSVRAIAEWSVNALYANEIAEKKISAKRESVQKRQQRRSVGAPAKNGRQVNAVGNGQVFDGPMSEDPDILNAVRGVIARHRA